MSKNVQKEPWFLQINPNGRIPALTDTFNDGKPIRLFESGSIMQYLVEQYDTKHVISYPKGSRESYEVNSWMYFLNAGVGPMQVGRAALPLTCMWTYGRICAGPGEPLLQVRA